jgi:hypothetical protein
LSRPFAVAFALAVAVTLVASFLSSHATGTELFGEVPVARSPCLDFLRFFRTHATDTEAFVRFPEHDRFFLRSSVLFAFNSGVVGGQYPIMLLSFLDFILERPSTLQPAPSGATLAVFMQGS